MYLLDSSQGIRHSLAGICADVNDAVWADALWNSLDPVVGCEGGNDGAGDDDPDDDGELREEHLELERRRQAIEVIRGEAEREFGDDPARVGEFTAEFAFKMLGELSTRELARALGTSHQYIYRLEAQALASAEKSIRRKLGAEDVL